MKYIKRITTPNTLNHQTHQRINITVTQHNKRIKFAIHCLSLLCIVRVQSWVYFLFAPTLVFEVKYPQTTKIRLNYVINKLAAGIGVL